MSRKLKDSGVQWIGSIPKDWDVIKVKKAFKRKNIKAMIDNPIILSLTSKGIKVRDITKNEGQIAESYYNYNPVEIGDLLLNPMDLITNAFSSVSNVKGVISPAYFNLQALDGYNAKYYDYYFKLQYWGLAFFAYGKGVSFENRWTLNNETLMNYKIPYPAIKEQNVIVEFLDKKVSQIDDIISKQKILIEKYKDYKQSLIAETVTKGLNKNVPMKDSGVEWIGKIPSEWSIIKTKNIYKNVKEVVGDRVDNYDRLALTLNGVVKRSKNDSKGLQPEKFEGYQILKKNELVFKLIDLENVSTSRVGLSSYTGIVSPAYIILNNDEHSRFGYYYFIFMYYQEIFNKLGGDGVRSSLSSKDLLNISYLDIPMEEQQKIVDYLDEKVSKIDDIISKKKILIEKLEDYKKSLIYECVTGKREVN